MVYTSETNSLRKKWVQFEECSTKRRQGLHTEAKKDFPDFGAILLKLRVNEWASENPLSVTSAFKISHFALEIFIFSLVWL